jgi:hypothetical protein
MKPNTLSGVSCADTSASPTAAPPLFAIRLRILHTADDAQWAKTFKVLCENRAACDEVWFSTGIGYPGMAWHEAHAKRLTKYAGQLRDAGIVPSLQIQATLGHEDDMMSMESTDGKTWGGFTGRGGLECRSCSCPRQPGFLNYMREMARLYASFRPGSVWIDDDLRIEGHASGSPWDKMKDGWIGCWCPTCLSAFGEETGRAWTRETLDAAMAKDAALFDRWEKFSFDGIVAVARAMAREIHAVSPGTRLGYQHGPRYGKCSQIVIFEALHAETGLPVGSRPGGGAYYDLDPNAQLEKAFMMARQRNDLGDPEWIGVWCPEIETYPSAFASRTAQGILNEAFVNLALGMNGLSLNFLGRYEPVEWYGENLFAPLSVERPFFDAYLRDGAGTLPAGFADATSAAPGAVYHFALAGVPVLPGPGRAFGTVVDADLSFRIEEMTSSMLLDLRHRFDERSGHRVPVVVETPSVGLAMPRMAPDGTLRTVAFINARIDVQKQLTLRLRGVPSGTAAAIWHEMRCKPVRLELKRDGRDALVTVPSVGAWNGGWLGFE